MSAENKGWGQALLIGAGVVAIGGGLWYLYTNRETYSHINDKAPEVDEQTSLQENKGGSEERPPLKNSLPPLPERPTAAQRKARSSKQSKPSDQTSSPEKPATAAKAEATKSGDGASSSLQATKANDAAETVSDSGDGELPPRDYRS